MSQRPLVRLQVCLMLVLLALRAASADPPAAKIVPFGQVIDEVPGTFLQQGGRCQANLEVAELGGYLILDIMRIPKGRHIEPVEDVSGIAWASKDMLIHTVSPIYGKPGLFTRSCSTGQTRRIVAPKTVSKAYPDGADYFRLHSVSLKAPGKIRFYYAPAVDKVDFRHFPSDDFLFEVNF